MLQREAHGLMDELLAACEKEIFPLGTELFLVNRGGDHGCRIVFEGVSVDYFDSSELARMIEEYTAKLDRVKDADEGSLMLELLKPESS